MDAATAADFAAARFAIKRGLYPACRSKSGFWRTESGSVLEDEDMAIEGGWRIVTPALDPNDPDVIEQAAQRARAAYHQGETGMGWGNLPKEAQDAWRAVARAVLTPAPERDPALLAAAEALYDLDKRNTPWHEADAATRAEYCDHAQTVLAAAESVRVGGGEG